MHHMCAHPYTSLLPLFLHHHGVANAVGNRGGERCPEQEASEPAVSAGETSAGEDLVEPDDDESSNLSAIGPKPVRQEHSPFKAGGGILAQTPVSKEVFDILKQREEVKQLYQAKFETNSVMRKSGTIENNAQLKDLTGGVQVNHIDPQLFDNPYNIPWVDFYCGGGGMGHGSVKKQGKFNLILE